MDRNENRNGRKEDEMNEGWIGIDLDGTLAEYDGWKGVEYIGKPIPSMVKRVKEWISEGKDVRIFTARVCMSQSKKDLTTAHEAISAWCRKYIGKELKITAEKDWKLIKLWDDRCVSVIQNTGEIIPLDSNERVKELEAERDQFRKVAEKLVWLYSDEHQERLDNGLRIDGFHSHEWLSMILDMARKALEGEIKL